MLWHLKADYYDTNNASQQGCRNIKENKIFNEFWYAHSKFRRTSFPPH
jgi:hypothetical protein